MIFTIRESKMNQDKFKNLAEKRVNNVIRQIRLVSNLSNRHTYDYNDDQIKRIFTVLRTELDTAQAKFKASKANKAQHFTL